MPENEIKIDALTPNEILEKSINIGVNKANLSIKSMLLLSILAGMFIAFGAVFSSVAATGMAGEWPYGFMRVIQGLVFSLGLILVVVCGAELFTGNSLMITAWAAKKISLGRLFRNWSIVYLGNFAGSLLVVLMVLLSKEYMLSKGVLGSVMLTTASAKVQYGFIQALTLGVLCNIMVCLAVWMTWSGRSVIDKILAIIGPITFFIAAGFEHSVANMYIIPLGVSLKVFDPAFVSSLNLDLSSLTLGTFFIKNLIPVTLGNMIGGGFFVGFLYFWAFRKKRSPE